MNEFVITISSFPTVIFSLLLIVVVCFWLLAILGVVDLDIASLDLEIDAETDASGVGLLGGLLLKFGLHGIPVSVIASALILLAWLIAYFGSVYLIAWIPGTLLKAIAGTALLIASLILALPIVGASLRPIRPLFNGETAAKRDSVVGQSCVVRSLEVNEEFGQAETTNPGASLILTVRAKTPNTIKQGDIVAITAYDEATATYQVMPEEEFQRL